jgi:tetratricopeptide (TPR) repeat protein
LWRSDYTTAKELYEQALPLFRKVGDLRREANCIWRLGDVSLRRLDQEAAENLYEQAISLYRRIGFLYGEAKCILRLGDVAYEKSDYVSATERYKQALSLFGKVGSVWGEAACTRCLGDIALKRADHLEARRSFNLALASYEQVEDPLNIGSTHLRLARLAENESERNQHVQAARAVWERIDRPDLIRELEEEFGNRAGQSPPVLESSRPKED